MAPAAKSWPLLPPSVVWTRLGLTLVTNGITLQRATCPAGLCWASSMPRPTRGCKMWAPTAIPTASPWIPATITCLCLCSQGRSALRKVRTAASPCTLDSEVAPACKQKPALIKCRVFFAGFALAHAGFLVIAHLPLPVALQPQFAYQHPLQADLGFRRKLHGEFVGHQSRIRIERQDVQSKKIVSAHDRAVYLTDRRTFFSRALTIVFDGYEIVCEQITVRLLVLVLERLPLRVHIGLQQVLHLPADLRALSRLSVG